MPCLHLGPFSFTRIGNQWAHSIWKLMSFGSRKFFFNYIINGFFSPTISVHFLEVIFFSCWTTQIGPLSFFPFFSLTHYLLSFCSISWKVFLNFIFLLSPEFSIAAIIFNFQGCFSFCCGLLLFSVDSLSKHPVFNDTILELLGGSRLSI